MLVDPTIEVRRADGRREQLSLDAVQCQTYVSKLLGSLDGWQERLMVTKESGYNFVHFTPLEALGYSRSAYSLADHRRLDETFTITVDQGTSLYITPSFLFTRFTLRVAGRRSPVVQHRQIFGEFVSNRERIVEPMPIGTEFRQKMWVGGVWVGLPDT